MSYTLAIFDMDGTILDTLDDLAQAINAALKQNALPERTRDEVRQFVGNGLYNLVRRAVPSGTSESVQKNVFDSFNEFYARHSADNTKPYEGILDVLKNLKESGTKVAVCSNKPDYAVQKLCETYFPGIFDAAVGAKDKEHIKPCPDSVNRILSDLGVPKEECVYIGDSDVDIKTAENAGMDCISVSWGFRSEDFLKQNGATHIVGSADELFSLVRAGR